MNAESVRTIKVKTWMLVELIDYLESTIECGRITLKKRGGTQDELKVELAYLAELECILEKLKSEKTRTDIDFIVEGAKGNE